MGINAQQLRAKIAQIKTEIDPLREYWSAILPCQPPSDLILKGWLIHFDFNTIVGGINAYYRVCSKNEGAPYWEPSTDSGVSYASGAMWKIHRGETFERERKFEDGTPYPGNWDELDNDTKRQWIASHREDE